MELEDFDDDDAGLTTAQLIARERAALGKDSGLNSALRGGSSRRGADNDFRIPAAGNTAGRGGFGLDSELERDSKLVGGLPPAGEGPSLASGLQRLNIHDRQPHPADDFGLAAEAHPPPPQLPPPAAPPPSGSRMAPLAPLGRNPLQPLAGPSRAPPSRTGPGLSPLRPLAPPALQQLEPPQDSRSFGLVAEAADPYNQPPTPLPAPLTQPLSAAPAPARAFGLASEVHTRAGELPLEPQQPAVAPRRPLPGGPGEGYGLGSEVRAAAARDMLLPGPAPPLPSQQQFSRPSSEYGLAGDVQAEEVSEWQRRQQPQQQQGGYGLVSEVGAAEQQQQQLLQPPPGMQPGGDMGFMGLQPPQPQPQDYGLDNDIAEQQQQQQQYPGGLTAEYWTQPFADTFSLDQVPEDQRWLQLSARQAERLMQELHQQGGAPRVVDIKDVREKLLDASAPPRLAYLAAVEQAAPDHRMSPNCRASLLQTKLKAGQNRLRKLLDPVLDPGGQGFVDLSYTAEGALLPESSRVWQFGLSLVQADGVGKTGLQRVRQPCLYIARLALFDRRANRFLGNVLGVRPTGISQYDKRWNFNQDDKIIVRCGCVQSDPQAGTRLVNDDALSLFVEFNVSYRLTVMDTANMPQNEGKSSQLLDEINTCWAMISFRKCLALQREVQISVPLYHGSIYDPQPMSGFYAEKRSKTPFMSAFKGRESPVLQFRVGPLNTGRPPLVPYAFMPSTMLATHDLGTALAAYRMSAALQLARQAGPFAAAADPVLAGFPPLLADHHLLAEFLARWKDLTSKMSAILDPGCCAPEVLPPLSALVEAFRRCTIELAPLAHCPTIPPRHINNFVEYQGHRLRLVQHYCHVVDPASRKILGARHPVEPLSHAGFEFLHAPFDTAEVRVCMADRLERPEPFYRH